MIERLKYFAAAALAAAVLSTSVMAADITIIKAGSLFETDSG